MSTSHTPPSGRDGQPFPLPHALQQALIAADAKHRASLDALRDAIRAYVEDLQGQGVPAADIAWSVRGRVSELRAADRTLTPSTPDDGPPPDDGLVDQIVVWCMEAGTSAPQRATDAPGRPRPDRPSGPPE